MNDTMCLEASLVPQDRFGDRRRAAMSRAREGGLDALLAWGRGGEVGESANNILYFANHFSPYPGQPQDVQLTAIEHAGVLIDGDGHGTLLVTDFVSEDVAADEIRRSEDLYRELGDTIEQRGLSAARIGLAGSEAFPYPLGVAIRERFPRIDLVPADAMVAAQRMALGPCDVEMLRNAANAGTRIVQAICDAAVPGVSEGEAVGAGMVEAARTPGCIHWAFMIASGPDAHHFVRSGTPAWNPTYVYRPGDALHIDCYGYVFGYQYDLMRTVVVGADPTPAQERTILAARNVIAGIAGLLSDGVTPRQLHDGGLRLASENGVDTSGSKTFGHGINLGWAAPWLQTPLDRPGVDEPLKAPSAYAFETFVSDGSGNYAKWEDTYVWTETALERLTGACPGPEIAAPMMR